MSGIAIVAVTLGLCLGSAMVHAAGPYKDKVKDKGKHRSTAPISVPDGDPSTALLLAIGALGVGAMALARQGLPKRDSHQQIEMTDTIN
jgi:hypothetical protein